METILTSTTGLIPMLLSLIGVLATLQYLKGMKDLSKAMRFVFWGFLFIFLAKLQVFAFGVMPQKIYYFCGCVQKRALILFISANRSKNIRTFCEFCHGCLY